MAIEQEKLVKLEALALEWVNQNFDISPPLLELPQGEQHDTTKCPVAVALNENCEGEWLVDYKSVEGYSRGLPYRDHPDVCITLSHEVTLFIEAFDSGYYPELIEKGE